MPKLFWAALVVGTGMLLLPPVRETRKLELTPMGLAWAGLMLWGLLSLLWSVQPRVAFERWAILLLWSGAYILARRSRFWESERFWTGFAALFSLTALIGCLQFFAPALPGIRGIPATGLPASTMGHRNYAAMYLVVTIPFVIWLVVRSRGPRRILPLLAAGLGLAFLVFTRARQAWLALMVASLALLIMCNRRVWQPLLKVYWRWLAAGALLLLLVSFLPASQEVFQIGWRKMPDEKKTVISTLLYPFQRGGDPRMELWQPAAEWLNPAQYPLRFMLGSGLGNYPIRISPVLGKVHALDFEVHNDYLQMLLELGLPGLLLFGAFVFLLLTRARQARDGAEWPAAAAAVGFFFVLLLTFTSEKVPPILWMAGVAAILSDRQEPRIRFSLPGERTWFAASRLAPCLFFLIGALFVAGNIWGERQFFRSERNSQMPDFQYLSRQVLPRMQSNANMVFKICHRWGSLALPHDPEAAEIFARTAFSRHPANWSALSLLGRIAYMEGDIGTAIHFQERAVRMGRNSLNSQLWVDMRNLYEDAGRYHDARRAGREMTSRTTGKAVNPSPPHDATGIGLAPRFEWEPARNAERYTLTLWPVGQPMPSEHLTSHSPRTWVDLRDLGMTLEPGTQYWWTVKSFGANNNQDGDIWLFETAPAQTP